MSFDEEPRPTCFGSAVTVLNPQHRAEADCEVCPYVNACYSQAERDVKMTTEVTLAAELVQQELLSVYLIWSNEHNAWWRPASRGYTVYIEEAGRYTREEALKICKGANYGFYQDDGENPNEIPVLESDALETMSAKPFEAKTGSKRKVQRHG